MCVSDGDECRHLDVVADELAALQTFVADFDDEVHVALLWVELADEVPCCLDGTAGCKQVVVDEDHIVLFD